MRNGFNNSKEISTGIPKTNDVTYNKGLYQGKRYVGLTNRGITEIDDYLSVTVIHALIHSGGIIGDSSRGRTWAEYILSVSPYDLRYLGKKYDDIIDSCQDNKSRFERATGKGENGQ